MPAVNAVSALSPRRSSSTRQSSRSGSAAGDRITLATPELKLSQAQQQAFDRLTAGDQDRLRRIAGRTSGIGRLYLGRLIETPSLLGSKDLVERKTLLDRLDALSTRPLAPGFDRAELLQALIMQTQDPGEISQGARGTCVPTTIEYMLAAKHPAEYVRVVSDLASPDGRARLASGAYIFREPGTENRDDSGRTVASRLFEAAMMEFGNGILDYRNDTDRSGAFGAGFGGLTPRGATKLTNAALNEKRRTVLPVPGIGQVPFTSLGSERVMKELEQAVAKGQWVPAAIDWRATGEWRPSGHEVLVLKIEAGRVYFRNPWGPDFSKPGTVTDGKDGPVRRIEDDNGVESMPSAEFAKRLKGIAVR